MTAAGPRASAGSPASSLEPTAGDLVKIVIPGGSGHVGTFLSTAFHRDGHQVVVLSRSPQSAPWRVVQWDGQNLGDWAGELNGADVLINLAGYTVDCRYNTLNRQRIMDSRVDSTRVLGEAVGQLERPPPTWLQASTATIYAHTYGPPNDEATGVLGGSEPDVPETWRFSIDVATAWERTFDEADVPGTRKVAMRTAITLVPDPGGAFDILARLARLGLGGHQGDGRQYMSWVHYEDLLAAVYWLIDHADMEGPVNVAAPNPLTNHEFMRELRQALGVRIGLPATVWMLEIGAAFLKSETELILKSRRVVPGRLLESGFTFQYPTWKEAAVDLCAEWRARRRAGRGEG